MSAQHQYRGDLSTTTLPEVLYSIDRFRVSGVIEATHDGVLKKVFLKDGFVVHAASSSRDDSLGNYLRSTGRLTPEALDVLARARESSKKRFGVLLFEHYVMAPEEVFVAIRDHIEAIVWSLFEWREGEITFTMGQKETKHAISIQLPLRQVIFHGIKRMDNARELVARLGKKDSVFEPSFTGEDLIEMMLTAEEYKLLQLVDGRRTLYSLCADGPASATANAKLLYAFYVLHLVRKVQKPTGGVKIQLKTTGRRMGPSPPSTDGT